MKKHNVSIKLVNEALKKAGLDCEIAKGNGYFYFHGPDMDLAKEQGVYGVYFLYEMSVKEWVESARAKIEKGL